MERIELYRKDPRAIAEMLAIFSSCVGCPMRETCTGFAVSDRCTGVGFDVCFRNWRNYYADNYYELESACDLSEMLESVIDCETCPVKEGCNPAECEYELEQWLGEEVTPAGATCRKMRQVDRPAPGDVVKIIATVTPQPIEGNMIRVITKNTGVVIYVSPDEIEAE